MEQKQPSRLAFGPANYRLMFIGIAVLAAGFITMTLDTEDYGEGFLGITLGPILLFIGFVIEFFAIMKRSGDVAADSTYPTTLTPGAPVAGPSATPVTPVPPTTPAVPSRPAYKRP
ncbi:DUF3098 domain-containing protein [Hymenobacter sp. BT175]|uniref:DUF3098 domain-containing protein n=1 Tax=Hymenobacter translucens TaxID=2886507 RepID=UPI001D0F2713|nr:DUF3098 domain-containing protein [Hymenobacter translucens]MCC2547095.1 DUF3098 domain-containing protein [Hymenobacter translucens]